MKITPQMYIEEKECQKAQSRFGKLQIPRAEFPMPAMSPGIQSAVDARALVDNIMDGLNCDVITPYLSTKQRYWPSLTPLIHYSTNEYFDEPPFVCPLIVPDPEYEAKMKTIIYPPAHVGLGRRRNAANNTTKSRNPLRKTQGPATQPSVAEFRRS
jgi:hypothetical protein